MLRLIRIFPLIILAVALSLGGCGGGGDEGATISKAAFIKRGDLICRKADKKQEAEYLVLARKVGNGGSVEQIAAQILLPSVLEQAKELEELGSPDGDEEAADAIIAGIRAAAKESEETLENEPLSFEKPFVKVSNLAASYGFSDCTEVI
jgi:hypothetical protein